MKHISESLRVLFELYQQTPDDDIHGWWCFLLSEYGNADPEGLTEKAQRIRNAVRTLGHGCDWCGTICARDYCDKCLGKLQS